MKCIRQLELDVAGVWGSVRLYGVLGTLCCSDTVLGTVWWCSGTVLGTVWCSDTVCWGPCGVLTLCWGPCGVLTMCVGDRVVF